MRSASHRHASSDADMQNFCVCGVVTSVRIYGAIFDTGGARGLLHISQITRKRLTTLEHVLQVGQACTVSCPVYVRGTLLLYAGAMRALLQHTPDKVWGTRHCKRQSSAQLADTVTQLGAHRIIVLAAVNVLGMQYGSAGICMSPVRICNYGSVLRLDVRNA